MRKLFIQFYLLLIGCFLVAVILVGVVYKQAVDKVGERYLSDLLRTTLSLIETELRGVPQELWQEKLSQDDHRFTFHVKLERESAYDLDDASRAALARGEIVMLENNYLFLQKIENSDYVLVAGPLRYLFFLHQLKWFDYALLALIGLSLAFPVLLWMRPHWRDLMTLEQTATRLAHGHFSARARLPESSGVRRVGQAFNRMADSIAELLASKKALTNAVAHELRTPLARLRYRLELLDDADAPAHQAMARDLDEIDRLIEELLLHAKLDRPEAPLTPSTFDAASWLDDRIAGQMSLAPTLSWMRQPLEPGSAVITADHHLLTRVLDNLLSNARRYTNTLVRVSLRLEKGQHVLIVDDDGPGIPQEDRERVFSPFVRLDSSRHRSTGGHGLGLAIVERIARAHRGQVRIDTSPEGGARFIFTWPEGLLLHSVTRGNKQRLDAPGTDD
ncbi:MAG: two-component system sensor histidine kinase RstB [Paludibacterium sp.]|uniref:two-component system sensor histidine kinase RstB n=1 Tax=Paludibacterium sp. TaxID=1917523 RepID=UPI0025DB05C6|nr:two-component system sensor histidine kinase RstB [Paludibacterium sp.]MBV8047364.1 two-component system sensor histidine kinase RstB [Paludibacterium sp.]MBV8646285.1 two-component system sensor histidine kinase RstB [Paludibacterium sp.]